MLLKKELKNSPKKVNLLKKGITKLILLKKIFSIKKDFVVVVISEEEKKCGVGVHYKIFLLVNKEYIYIYRFYRMKYLLQHIAVGQLGAV